MNSPLLVSCKTTFSRSPEFMKRSEFRSGVKVFSVDWIGFGGELGCGVPLFVRKAKFAYSIPVMLAQVELRSVPLIGSSARPKVTIATHHLLLSQLLKNGAGGPPGG